MMYGGNISNRRWGLKDLEMCKSYIPIALAQWLADVGGSLAIESYGEPCSGFLLRGYSLKEKRRKRYPAYTRPSPPRKKNTTMITPCDK